MLSGVNDNRSVDILHFLYRSRLADFTALTTWSNVMLEKCQEDKHIQDVSVSTWKRRTDVRFRRSGTQRAYRCVTLEIIDGDSAQGRHVSPVVLGENPAKSKETPTTTQTLHIFSQHVGGVTAPPLGVECRRASVL